MGSSQDVSERLDRHNKNKERATRNRGPWEILIAKEFATRSDAVRFEMKLKKWKNKIRILQWIENEKRR